MMEDSRIVGLFWARDPDAIPAASEKYGDYCAAVARNILRNPEDEEECVNDTWLRAWNAMPPHRPQLLRTFLGKLTRNLSLNRLAARSAQKRGGGDAVWEELNELVSGREEPMDEVLTRELAAAIDGFLATVSREQRSLFLRRYWYFDSIADLSARFGMSGNRVSVTLHRLRAKLKAYLTERGYDL